jgi:hypothetical protein
MKSKAARKTMRHAKPVGKRTSAKKQTRANVPPKTKETFRKAGAEPELIEMAEVTFDAPVQFIDADPEPVNEVIEIFEVEEEDDQGGW